MSAPPTAPPRARPGATVVALVVALVLLGLAVVAVHDLAAAQGWSSEPEWSRDLVAAVDGLTATNGVVAGGVAAVVAGFLVVVLALKPGRRTHLAAATSDSDVWVSPAAFAALACAVADRAPGVISAEATRVSRRQVVLTVVTQQDSVSVSDAVRAAVDDAVGGLTTTRVTVKTTELPR